MKKLVSLLLSLGMVLALLPVTAMAAERPNVISTVEFTIDAPKEGRKPSEVTATVTKVTRGTAQVTLEKAEWDGEFDANGGFQTGKEYTLTVGVRISGCSDQSDPPRFVSGGESLFRTGGTLRAGENTYNIGPSLQPTGDKQYVEFILKIPGHAVKSTEEIISTAHIADGEPGRVLAALKKSPYTFAGGSGTRADPYLISTPDQLNAIRQGMDKHYKLLNDIDLSAWGDWMPIGGEELERHGDPTPFTGSLDGAGHVIRGMTITGSRADYQREDQARGFEARCFGLFAHVKGQERAVKPGGAYDDATLGGVSNLGVVDYTINMDSSDVFNGMNIPLIGAIASRAENARIVGCWSSGGTAQASPDGLIGGIVGRANNAVIRECWNSSTLIGSEVGGIAVDIETVWVSHCFNAGTLKGGEAYGIATGQTFFAGNDPKKENVTGILYCYNSGSISGDSATGIGSADFMDNVYNAGDLGGTTNNAIANGTVGMGIAHSGERFLNDDNWVDSPTLGRKVLSVLREDELLGAAAPVKGVGGFFDVLPTDYFADAVLWAVPRKITTGTTNATFSPANTCSKAEALTFLYRAEGEPLCDVITDKTIRETFSATNDGEWFTAYYYYPSEWAYGLGMIAPTTYLPAPCTRGDFVTYLWRAAGAPKVAATGQFTDVPAGAGYAQAVAWAVAQGVTTGTSATTFSPDMTCTRGQIVTFLHRAYKDR